MSLSAQARDRLADLVELSPTKNGVLADRWDLDGGSDVHAYLESELSEYYYRDENSLIRASPDATALLAGEEPTAPEEIEISPLQAAIVECMAGPEDRSMSVVAILHALGRTADLDPDVQEVRRAIQGLRGRKVVEVVYRIVPTYRLVAPADSFEITIVE